MADLWETVRLTFWSEYFWFPENYTWKCMENTNPNVYKPQLSDLMVPVYLCLIICVVRTVFERCVGAFVSKVCHLRGSVKKAPHNPILEATFAKNKCPDHSIIESLSKQTDMRERQIERWFRIRRNQMKTPVLKKFCESSWRCIYYAVIFVYGLFTLWDKEWLWDTRMCWIGWPEHSVTPDVYWYYMVQAGFYLALSLSLFTDVKRKDFTEMIVHHIATLGLMFFSWMNNFVRIGSLVLLVHDCADPLMEAAKMAKYIKKEAICTGFFVLFLLTWVITRMTLYPTRIVYSTLFEATPVIGMCNVYYVYNGLLITLQFLHVIWFYFILLIAKDAMLGGGQLKKDSRSSDESVSNDEASVSSTSSSGDKGSGDKLAKLDQNGLMLLEQNGVAVHNSAAD